MHQSSERTKTVIVTGAGSGIGLSIARRFFDAGYNLVLNGRSEEKLRSAAEALGQHTRVALLAADVAAPNTGMRLVALARERFSGLDAVINNAGVFSARPFVESTREYLEAFLDTNLKGTYFTTQAAVPALIEAGGGAVVSIGTVLVEQAMTGLPVSAAMAAKGGVHALTVSLAAELAQHGIRVNAVAPGIVRTPLIGADADQHAGIHPLGRIGEPEEIAEAVHYLATAQFVTGSILPVDGGYAHGR